MRHSLESLAPIECDLTTMLPNLKDLQTSVDKLRDMCIPRELVVFCVLLLSLS